MLFRNCKSPRCLCYLEIVKVQVVMDARLLSRQSYGRKCNSNYFLFPK